MSDLLFIHWDGKQAPRELLELPPGRYIVAPGLDLEKATEEEWAAQPFTAIDNLKISADATSDDLLDQLRVLAPGQYYIESFDQPVELTIEEEAGLRLALEQVERGELISAEEVRRGLLGRSARR
jgi:hypothetical protein